MLLQITLYSIQAGVDPAVTHGGPQAPLIYIFFAMNALQGKTEVV